MWVKVSLQGLVPWVELHLVGLPDSPFLAMDGAKYWHFILKVESETYKVKTCQNIEMHPILKFLFTFF